MKCIALYHMRFEDLGAFAAPLAAAGYDISYRHAGAAPLTAEEWRDTELVVILGGPLGVADAPAYPWLAAEIDGIALRLASRQPTLGICLGAQLMAVALGGQVVPGAGKEIGWSPLAIAPGAGPLEHLRGVPVLHWHGDNIVPGAALLAEAHTEPTPCQAFRIGTHALGLQCHVEFDPAMLEEWLTGHAVELRQAGVDLAQLRADTRQHGPRLVQAGQALLQDWLRELAT